jgi:8-oxo-dGTP diphosphatase
MVLRTPREIRVTTDAVPLTWSSGEGLRILLVKRAFAPFQGEWALPGGFVEEEEDLPDACLRELEEETALKGKIVVQLGAWGAPDRDPRGRNVTVAYVVAVREGKTTARAGDDAARTRWFPVDSLPKLAFDHADIAASAMARLREITATSHAAFAFLPDPFKLDDLRELLQGIRGELVTEPEVQKYVRRARVVREVGETPREGEKLRCVAGDFLAPLK